MTPRRFPRLWKLALPCLFALSTAQACGPDFFPDSFVRTGRPDLPQQFVRGRLGLLQPGFARADLFVAFRYLNGGTLDSGEQAGWKPSLSLAEEYYGTPQPQPVPPETPTETSLAQWVAARAAYPNAPKDVGQDGTLQVQVRPDFQYDVQFLNCADDAFRAATETLAAREKVWGKASPELRDWLQGQDTVFGACSGPAATPAAAPAGSPALLLQDRAYQTAAAHFYSRAFPQAAQEFAAISKDRASPWQPGSGYLAARVLIRQAFFAKTSAETPAEYDAATMKAAEGQLRSFLAGNPSPAWRRAAEKQLALVRLRVEPDERTRELAALVSGPGHDPNYSQDLQDLLWITSNRTPNGLRAEPERYMEVPDEAHPDSQRRATAAEAKQAAETKRQAAFDGTTPERALAPIVDWALTLQSLSTTAPSHALEQWRSTHALPWLVAALVLAPGGPEGAAPDLLQAAAEVPAESPAWETVSYHRARLVLAAGHLAQAGDLLAETAVRLQQTPAAEREPSTVNAVRGLPMQAADTATNFLQFAPRKALLLSSEEFASVGECQEAMKHPERHYHCVGQVLPEQMDADAAKLLNEQAPLSFWITVAKSEALSPQLRGAIAAEGWTRAVLLDDSSSAAALLALLPPELKEQASAENRPLAVWMTLARNPGLRPYLNAGTQRAYSYDFVESYRDNWCYKPEEFDGSPMTSPAAFLSAAERQAGSEQAEHVAEVRSVAVGRRIVEAVQANVHDPQAPEALFLVLRMIRYGCTEPAPMRPDATADGAAGQYSQEARDLAQLKRDVGRLMRQHFVNSPWTKKAAPFVG